MALQKWGAQTTVNTNTVGEQSDAAVTTLANGDIVVVWCNNSPGGDQMICSQRYGADGSPIGGETTIGHIAGQDFRLPDVTALAGGGYVVTWTQDVNGGTDVNGKVFDADGTSTTGSFAQPLFNSAEIETMAEVTALAGGGFAVTCESGENHDIMLRLFSADGVALSDPIPVNTPGAHHQAYATVTQLTNGNIVIAWHENYVGIHYQVLNAAGVAVSAIMTASSLADSTGELALIPSGDGFMISWKIGEPDAGESEVRGAFFSATGGKLSAEFNAGDGAGDWPELALLPDGSIMSAWWTAGGHIMVRTFNPATGISSPPVQIDGTDSINGVGLNSALSLSVLEDGRVAVTWSTEDGDVAMQIVDPRDGVVNGDDGRDTLYGSDNFADHIEGAGGNDHLYGLLGGDTIHGGSGRDVIEGGLDGDTLHGGDGNDTIYGNTAEKPDGSGVGDQIWGNDGNDTVIGSSGGDMIEGGQGRDLIAGGAGADQLSGAEGADTLSYRDSDAAVSVDLGDGSAEGGHAEGDTFAGFEHLIGSNFGDDLAGSGSANRITGGRGKDVLTGGEGKDVFDFNAIIESKTTAFDRITDFNENAADRIDLSGIDAVVGGANGGFDFIGGAGFTALGQVRVYHSGGDTFVAANVDGSLAADMVIKLEGNHALNAADFVL